MSTESVSYTVREFITNHFSQARKRNLKDDDPLLESGVVDSLGVLDLVSFIESRFVVAVDDEELTPEHFNSISRIAAYVESKRGERA
jgi:acyl carrier protein